MNQENSSHDEPKEKKLENLGLPAAWEQVEEKGQLVFELTLAQKEALAKKMESYCQKHSIAYNPQDLTKTDQDTLKRLGGVFLNALSMAGSFGQVDRSMPVKKLSSAVDRGLMLRELDFITLKKDIGSWENIYKQDFKYQDYIGPLAIDYKKIKAIKERNQYLEPNLSLEKNFSKEIKERQVAFDELFHDLYANLAKFQNLSIDKNPSTEEKSIILRSVIFNFVKSGKPSPLIYPDTILKDDQHKPNELIWLLKGKEITAIDSQKWQQWESLCDNLYQQLANRIKPIKNEIKTSLDKKNFKPLVEFNKRVLTKYAAMYIPEIITRPELIELIPTQYQVGNLWQENKCIKINNYKIPQLKSLEEAYSQILANVANSASAKEHPELFRIKEAISAWQKYQKNLNGLENKENLLKKDQQDVSSKLIKFQEPETKLSAKENEEILNYLKKHPDKDTKTLIMKFNEKNDLKHNMEGNLDMLESIKENVEINLLDRLPENDFIKKLISERINYLRALIENIETKKLSKIDLLTQKKADTLDIKIQKHTLEKTKREEQLKQFNQIKDHAQKKEIWDSIYPEKRYQKEKAIIETIDQCKKNELDKLQKYFSKEWTDNIRNLLEVDLSKRVTRENRIKQIGSISVSSKNEIKNCVDQYFKQSDIDRIKLFEEILNSPFAYEINTDTTISEYLENILLITRYASFQLKQNQILEQWKLAKLHLDEKLKENFVAYKIRQLENTAQQLERIKSGNEKKKINDDFVRKMTELNFTLEKDNTA